MSKKEENLSFEKNLEQLEAILSRLEQGELPLEDQLQLFESGVGLSRTCLQKLEEVEKRVEQLVVSAQGDLSSKAMDLPSEA